MEFNFQMRATATGAVTVEADDEYDAREQAVELFSVETVDAITDVEVEAVVEEGDDRPVRHTYRSER
jgi:hypothetical protein